MEKDNQSKQLFQSQTTKSKKFQEFEKFEHLNFEFLISNFCFFVSIFFFTSNFEFTLLELEMRKDFAHD